MSSRKRKDRSLVSKILDKNGQFRPLASRAIAKMVRRFFKHSLDGYMARRRLNALDRRLVEMMAIKDVMFEFCMDRLQRICREGRGRATKKKGDKSSREKR